MANTKTKLTALPTKGTTFTSMGMVYNVISSTDMGPGYGLGFVTCTKGRGKQQFHGQLSDKGVISWTCTLN